MRTAIIDQSILRSLYPVQSYIRSIISPRRRFHHRHGNIFAKMCVSPEQARREAEIMTRIGRENPSFFVVPHVVSVVNHSERSWLLTEFVEGSDLLYHVESFLEASDDEPLQYLFNVGRALRELSEMNLGLEGGCGEHVSSQAQLLARTIVLCKELRRLGFLTQSHASSVVQCMKNTSIDDFLFEYVNVHNGISPSNVMITDSGRPLLVDFVAVCRGPRYVDLASLTQSLYSSSFIHARKLKKLEVVREKVIRGYGKEDLVHDALKRLNIIHMLGEAYRSYLCMKQQSVDRRIVSLVRLNMLKERARYLISYEIGEA